jgi:hypothetical protein
VEWRPVPSVVLMATHYDDDRFNKGQWLAGVRFEFPLGRSPKEQLTPRRRTLQERLLEPARRRHAPQIGEAAKTEQVAFVDERGERLGMERIQMLGDKPQAGQVIFLDDGTAMIVTGNGSKLRSLRSDEVVLDGYVDENGRSWVLVSAGPDEWVYRPARKGEYVAGIDVIPEPSRALLLVVGIATILMRRRRVSAR